MNDLKSQIKSGQINGHVLSLMKKMIKAGITGLELEEIATKEIKRLGGKPAFVGVNDYRYTSCISVNNVLVHGIPNNIPFKPGDTVSVDMGVNFNGWLTDAAITVAIEPTNDRVKLLIKATQEALAAGIEQAKIGNRVGDISWAIQGIANKYHFGIAKDLAGHGITKTLHEEPTILNYGEPDTGPILKEGMTIAIEPMFALHPDNNSTDKSSIFLDRDGWSICLENGNIGSHSEHTIIISKDKPIILTNIVDISDQIC
jgi:methionyl aminopeptidase